MSGATLNDAITYILSCRPAPYVWWYSGGLYEGPPAWSENAAAPDPAAVQQGGLFCAAVGNLMRRVVGWEVPYRPSLSSPYREEFDGGTLAWWEYFYGQSEWFDVNRSYPDGTCFLKQYIEGASQGHWATCYQGYIIDSTDATGNGQPGLQWEKTVAESNSWIGYDIAIMPEVWMPVGKVSPPPVQPPSNPESVPFSVALLKKAMPNLSPENAELYFPYLLSALKEFEINTRERLSAFLAQVGHESGDFFYWSEIDGENKRYNPFYGRSPIQLTWLENYRRCGEALGLDLVDKPDLLLLPENGFRASGWFWRYGVEDLNPYADEATWSSFSNITLRINGGDMGEGDRDNRYLVAWNALPPGLTLDTSEAPEVDPQEPPKPPPTESPFKRLARLKQRLDALLTELGDIAQLEKAVDEIEKEFKEIKELLK